MKEMAFKCIFSLLFYIESSRLLILWPLLLYTMTTIIVSLTYVTSDLLSLKFLVLTYYHSNFVLIQN